MNDFCYLKNHKNNLLIALLDVYNCHLREKPQCKELYVHINKNIDLFILK